MLNVCVKNQLKTSKKYPYGSYGYNIKSYTPFLHINFILLFYIMYVDFLITYCTFTNYYYVVYTILTTWRTYM